MKRAFTLFIVILAFVFSANLKAQEQSDKFDLGKMWTFEHAPAGYFNQVYGFSPDAAWLNDVKLSALRFGNGCSASFISEDGLVMTNHHCGRGYVTSVTKPGEDFSVTGFWAETLADERPVPGLWVDQLINTIDVTKEIQDAFESGKTNTDKEKNKTDRIKEIEAKYKNETGLQCNVITFYNGGMYMLYCYKRYRDVRLVFSPENNIAHFGGDPDNFTYPRYGLDCAYFRVYENGQPYKTPNHFNWSPNGAKVGEPLFVIGNPGSTERLKTYAQLEFARDFQIPYRLESLDFVAEFLDKYIQLSDEKRQRYQDAWLGAMNSQKVFKGQLKALKDPVMMERKKDFENHIRSIVNSKPELKSKYGNVWDEIEAGCRDYSKIFTELAGYEGGARYNSRYYSVTKMIFRNTMEDKPVKDSIIEMQYRLFDADYNKTLLKLDCETILSKLGSGNDAVKKVFGNRTANEMVDYILANSLSAEKEGALKLAAMSKEELMKSSDPLIRFFVLSKARYDELSNRQKEAQARIDVNAQNLGRIIFDIYGTTIPPDATLTLRISDGEIKTYDYNGTRAQPFTTFYGLYERYFGNEEKSPWMLPERWKTPPPEFRLATPFNLITTNDIIGGNSGSALINTKKEVVGLVFDGNIESLPGRYIYTTDYNRTVAVDSRGLLEAIKNMYKAKRLADEIENGKIMNQE
ncbi:MAG: S46 family peptidase [Bacteroidetes bacterium]|nr:S46 family peptidase [Bacteroidota bacterium]